jgi:hypothetical protein
VKWALIAFVTVAAIAALWKYGFIEEFLGPWAAWANFIGYFS